MIDNKDVERKIVTILRILSDHDEPVGAVVIARELEDYGIRLDSRTVRYHLKIMDERGLTKKHGREGRTLAPAGERELRDSLVFDRVGTISSRLESLCYHTTFDPDTREGRVVVNTAFIPSNYFDRGLQIIFSVLNAGIGISRDVVVRESGEMLGDLAVPDGMTGVATICSLIVNAVLLKKGIPVDARFGGVLEMRGGRPAAFTDMVAYRDSTVDPFELFTRGRFTSIAETVRSGRGRVLASFREIPSNALARTEQIIASLESCGFSGIHINRIPGQDAFGAETTSRRCGIAVIGGLNCLAACLECGIPMQFAAISTLIDRTEMQPVETLFHRPLISAQGIPSHHTTDPDQSDAILVTNQD